MEWKRPVKKLGRPAAKLVTRAVTRVVGSRLAALEAEGETTRTEIEELRGQLAAAVEPLPALGDADAEIRADFDKLRERLTAVLDAVADQHAHTRAAVRAEGELQRQTAEQARRIADIEQRTEVLRRDLSSLRLQDRGLRTPTGDGDRDGLPSEGGDGTWPQPKVLNEEKLRSFGGDIRLNLGAGTNPVEDFLNVDTRALDGIDIVADVRSLPFGPGEVTTLFSSHLLQRLPLEELRGSVLPYWLSLLSPGGQLIAVVPDAESTIEGYSDGDVSFEDLREMMFGDPEDEGDLRRTMFSQASLMSLLVDAGFVDPAITGSHGPRGAGFELHVEARRPSVRADRAN
jgi:hypothetical protein